MALADEIRNTFAPVLATGRTGADLAAALVDAMGQMSDAELAVLYAGVGVEVGNKRSLATAIATAVETVRTAAPLLALVL